ncbi:hypothetical protein LCGC14_1116770 [marine sediment metagenome]|uniref:DUF5131 family protein n=2 Tax=root TaxID=1 RepID=A0A9C9TJ07_9HYPH|nr:DUF5131 family protein [Aurantimonas coralicida]
MGRITNIAWTAVPVGLAGHERCPTPGCRAELFIVDGVQYHPGATHNPWWGCVKIGPECAHCYACAFDHRLAGGHWGKDAPRRFFGAKHWDEPRRLNRHAEQLGVRLRVFCASMADVFEDRPDLVTHRSRLWTLIQDTPHLDWLLLTKRPENFSRMLPWHTEQDSYPDIIPPWPNVWLGVTAGTQETADELIPILLDTPAALRFVSYEPALEAVDFSRFMSGIDWLIAGSESGPKARPAELDWYRAARDQCDRGDVPFVLKQFADRDRKIPLPLLDGRQHFAFPR